VRTFRGECFLNRNLGVDYFGTIFVKGPTPEVVRAQIRDEVLGTVGVGDVPTVNLDVDSASRALSVELGAETDYGEVVATLTVTPP
jgi:hypothetical protein